MLSLIEHAKAIVSDVNNGSVTGISTGKGGRAWIDGEFTLEELEALCLMIRSQPDFVPEGLMESFHWAVDEEAGAV